MPGRCQEFTDMVYSGKNEMGMWPLWEKIQQTERKFHPPVSQYQPFIGEMHGHTAMSEGMRSLTPELYFERLKSLPGLDFAALSDHDHGGVATAELWDEGKWERIQKAVQSYYEPGKFTSLLAYERDYPLLQQYDHLLPQRFRGNDPGRKRWGNHRRRTCQIAGKFSAAFAAGCVAIGFAPPGK